ncbi:hypothetical protein D3C74_330590 [compost metagenome]
MLVYADKSVFLNLRRQIVDHMLQPQIPVRADPAVPVRMCSNDLFELDEGLVPGKGYDLLTGNIGCLQVNRSADWFLAKGFQQLLTIQG